MIPHRRFSLWLVLLLLVSASAHAQTAPCVDINTASEEQLQRIVHIGPARAKQVIALRAQTPFRTVDELVKVTGIAEARLRDIKAQAIACVRSGTGDPPPTPVPTGPCVDINSASEEELQRITQIGPARAKSLVALRPFRSVEDLTRISGIGDARLAQIKAQGLACVKNHLPLELVQVSLAHRQVVPNRGVFEAYSSTPKLHHDWR